MSVMAHGSKTYFLICRQVNLSLTHSLLLQATLNQICIWITTQVKPYECPQKKRKQQPPRKN